MKKIYTAADRISAIFIMVISVLIIFALTGCEKSKVVKIGIVNINYGLEPVIAGFKSGMKKYGYIEGENIIYIDKSSIQFDQMDAVLKELVNRKVDLLFVVTTPVAKKAKEIVKGTSIPVVFAPVLYPVRSGLIESLIHPGGNLTGIQAGGSTEKALELHKTAVPGSKRIFVPWKQGDEVAEQSLTELKEAAANLGVELVLYEGKTMDELKAALDNIPDRVDSIWLLNSAFLVSNVDLLVKSAIKHKLPLSSGTSQYNNGVMLSYGQKHFKTGEQAARLAHRILGGIPPSDLPVETADFYLGINLRTERAIGLKIPDDVLLQADDIVR